MDKKEDSIINKITKVRLRWYVVVGALLGLAIGTPTLVPLVSFSDLPDHPFAEWTDSRIPFKDCPEHQLWYRGYMSGCVPEQFDGLARDSEIFIQKFPTVFDENGMNTFKSGKEVREESKQFERTELLLECDYNYGQILEWIGDGSVLLEDLQTFMAKCGSLGYDLSGTSIQVPYEG